MRAEASMSPSPATCAEAIAHSLATGQTDPRPSVWPGGRFLERARRMRSDLREALVAEVLGRT